MLTKAFSGSIHKLNFLSIFNNISPTPNQMLNYDKYHPRTKLLCFDNVQTSTLNGHQAFVTMERNSAPAIHSNDTRRFKIEKYSLVKRGRKPWFQKDRLHKDVQLKYKASGKKGVP